MDGGIEDIFASSLNLEETHFKEGCGEGHADGLIAGRQGGEPASGPQNRMDELLEKYPILEPENETVSNMMDSLRFKFRATCASECEIGVRWLPESF
ncbi:Unknown protein [Striga hermonthica]|uniref:Uncharacterized protein n=1 Tax=Striga hermonthica TaxID=68872 RepID=A0A9N7N7G3_STRHE|nr:Unknown protein [Striga hermonthica]